jgi:hypothetical protein
MGTGKVNSFPYRRHPFTFVVLGGAKINNLDLLECLDHAGDARRMALMVGTSIHSTYFLLTAGRFSGP